MSVLRSLDLEAVQAFVLVADLHSFTGAAQALGVSQSAVSLKLKRLEAQLGRRLVERTPRLVRLSAEGGAFLEPARALLTAQERALAGFAGEERRLVLGISEHVAGAELPAIIARLHGYDPRLVLEMRLGLSQELREEFERGRFDAIIARREGGRSDGESLFREPFGWFAGPGFEHRPDEPLPLTSLAAPCGVRALAIRALDAAGLGWREAFVGGGLAAVAAAVTAGLGIAALARRLAPAGSIDIGAELSLPALPDSEVVLYSTVSEPRARGALRTLAAALRHSAA